MPVGFKHRYWEAFVSISANGPEFSKVFENGGYAQRTRMAADLAYTTADVDYLYEHFTTPEPDRPRKEERHYRLVNPTRSEVLSALTEALDWLGTFRSAVDWDGGGLHLNYAGHGQEPDGALVLSDGTLSVDEFLSHILPQARQVSPPGRLRLSIVLDSCHSGAWVTRILDRTFNQYSDCLIPFNLFASCMQDEFALEDSTIGHGLFTYCFSVRSPFLNGQGAQAILPDNTFGPSLSIAGGELGCSLLSAGSQNPLAYWNGAGQLEVSQESFSIERADGDVMSEKELVIELKLLRDKVRIAVSGARRGSAIEIIDNDTEMRASIRALRHQIESFQNTERGLL